MGKNALITFYIKGVRVDILFSFFVIVAISSLGHSLQVATVLFCCVLHEAGHLLAMLCFKQKPSAVVAYGGGIKIKAPCLRVSVPNEALIYLSGPAVNLLLFILSVAAGKSVSDFSFANLSLCLFNLLPISHLDGGKVLRCIENSGTMCYNVSVIVRKALTSLLALSLLASVYFGRVSAATIAALGYIVISEYLG